MELSPTIALNSTSDVTPKAVRLTTTSTANPTSTPTSIATSTPPQVIPAEGDKAVAYELISDVAILEKECITNERVQETVSAEAFDFFIRVPEDEQVGERFPLEGMYLGQGKRLNGNELVKFGEQSALAPFLDDNREGWNEWGELAIIDLQSGQYEIPTELEDFFITARPVILPDGSLLLRSRETVAIWQEGVPLVTDQFRNGRKLSYLYYSPDLRFLLGIVHTSGKSSYVLQDRSTGTQTQLFQYEPLGVGYKERLAPWNGTDQRVAVYPVEFSAEPQGIYVVDALTGQTTYLGDTTSAPCWINADQLRFLARNNGEVEIHLYDAATQTRYRVVDAAAAPSSDNSDNSLSALSAAITHTPNWDPTDGPSPTPTVTPLPSLTPTPVMTGTLTWLPPVEEPASLVSVSGGEISNFYEYNGVIYALMGQTVTALDMKSETAPEVEVINRLVLPHSIWESVQSGRFLYVLLQGDVWVIDLSDPVDMRPVAKITGLSTGYPSPGFDVGASGAVYFADRENRRWQLDVDPALPAKLVTQRYDRPDNDASGEPIISRAIYREIILPQVLAIAPDLGNDGLYYEERFPIKEIVLGNDLYLLSKATLSSGSQGPGNLMRIDINDQADPTLISMIRGSQVSEIAFENRPQTISARPQRNPFNLRYTIDISDRQRPQLLTRQFLSYETDPPLYGRLLVHPSEGEGSILTDLIVDEEREILYGIWFANGMTPLGIGIFSIEDPYRPQPLAEIEPDFERALGPFTDILLDDTTLYTIESEWPEYEKGDDFRFSTYDVSDPANPVLLSQTEAIIPSGMLLFYTAANGEKSLVTRQDGEIKFWGVDDPTTPQLRHTLSGRLVGSYQDWPLSDAGLVLLTLDDEKGVTFWDASDPARPSELGVLQAPNRCRSDGDWYNHSQGTPDRFSSRIRDEKLDIVIGRCLFLGIDDVANGHNTQIVDIPGGKGHPIIQDGYAYFGGANLWIYRLDQ